MEYVSPVVNILKLIKLTYETTRVFVDSGPKFAETQVS